MRQIGYEDARGALDWAGAVEALRQGHLGAPPQIDDSFLGPAGGTLLNRSCFIPGLGYGAKAVTVFEANAARGLPTVQGAMLYFAPEDGRLQAVLDSRLVTEIKTASDSVLGALCLARPHSRELLICGAGAVAASLIEAYSALFPSLERISLWNRTPARATALAERYAGHRMPVVAVSELAEAAGQADIIATATLAREPFLRGEWVRPGTHVDLIGAFKSDMREADDTLLTRARLFVDSRDSTLGHIGELAIPLAAGTIAQSDVLGDLRELLGGAPGRRDDSDITLYKNGGGAHLDLMIARYIVEASG
ncbi:ornithine cyclodeaminase family protein [Salinicola tamaricis]|uniref:ornithine cyclodeaminase family protein n=1 Tax=Salinicola tamaricis TaxID=1771309 RepID=UPI000D0A07A7|nr:ornithine cyclodeaminase [Salinicola tamaricis]